MRSLLLFLTLIRKLTSPMKIPAIIIFKVIFTIYYKKLLLKTKCLINLHKSLIYLDFLEEL